jgi:hypothetical protein
MSYLGHLDFGIVADREQMPDVALLMGWLREELALLLASATPQPAAAVPTARRRSTAKP